MSAADPARRHTFASLRHANFRKLFAGQALSQIGTWMSQMAVTLLVLGLTRNGVMVGVLVGCQMLPYILVGPFAGVLGDRYSRQRLMVTLQFLLMAQAFVYAALSLMEDPPILAVFGVALAGGVVNGLEAPTRRAFVTDLVPDDLFVNAVSLNSVAMLAPRIVGPMLAGLVIGSAGFTWCFVIDGFSYAWLLGNLLLMRRSDMRPPAPVGRGQGRLFAVFPYVRRTRELWIPFVMLMIIGTLTFNFTVVLPLFVTDALHGPDTSFTVLYASLSFGSVVAALLAARRTTVTQAQIVTGAFALGVSMTALAMSPNLVSAYVISPFVGFASVMFMTTMTTMVQIRADATMRVSVLALQGMIMMGTTPVGGPLLGAISDLVDPRASVLIGGCGALIAAAWAHHVRERTDLAVPEPGSYASRHGGT